MKRFLFIVLVVMEAYVCNAGMKDTTAVQFIRHINAGCVGYNMGNTLDAWNKTFLKKGELNLGQETLWGLRRLTQADFDRLKGLGFTTVRIPVTWYYNTYYDAGGRLHIQQQWIRRVREVVDYAMNDGLSVILNVHFDCESSNAIYVGASNEKMDSVRNYSRQLWTIIANYFRKYDERLVFEAYNEPAPYPGWFYKHEFCVQINELNQLFVDAVRRTGGNNRKRVLIVPTLLNGMSPGYFADFIMPKDVVKDRIIVEIHDYDTRFDQKLEKSFDKVDQFSQRIGAPIIIGEFASKATYPFPEYRMIHISNFVARLRAHGMAGCYWDDGNLGNFGLISRRQDSSYCQMNMPMLEALRTPVKYVTSGNVSFTEHSQFRYVSMTDSATLLPNVSWRDGRYCSISLVEPVTVVPDHKYMYLTVDADHEVYDYVIKKYAFYDKNMRFLKMQDYGSQGSATVMCEVPSGAAYVNFSISKMWGECHTTETEYWNYIDKGDISVSVTFLHRNPQTFSQIKN